MQVWAKMVTLDHFIDKTIAPLGEKKNLRLDKNANAESQR